MYRVKVFNVALCINTEKKLRFICLNKPSNVNVIAQNTFGLCTVYKPFSSRNTFCFKACSTQCLSTEEARSLWVKLRDRTCEDLRSEGVKPSKKFSVQIQN